MVIVQTVHEPEPFKTVKIELSFTDKISLDKFASLCNISCLCDYFEALRDIRTILVA
jgi:hypothetical protein